MFFRRSKLAVVAALAATMLTAVPAGAETAAALGPCRVAPVGGFVDGWQVVGIAGVYTAPAGALSSELTCGAVVHGALYATVADEVPGPVAVVAGTGRVPQGEVSACYTLRVRYLTGWTSTGNCPAWPG